MAATLTEERFTGPDWLFERKLDGIRLVAFKRGAKAGVDVYSRTHRPQALPEIARAIAALPPRDLVLDGELTWRDGAARFHVFDVLWIDGEDVRGRTLVDRRAILSSLPIRAPLVRVPSIDDPEPWTRACAEGWEGVIAKRRDSVYESKRSKHWLKMKCELQQPFVVGGFTEPQGARVGLGALLVGYFDGDDFVFAGKVGTGFDTKLLVDLRARLERDQLDSRPFTVASGLPKVRAHWAHPRVVVQVAFLEWTNHGKLRHSRLLGLRDDIAPEDVRKGTR
jgi:bifunctional non-homologous end joining protein LigD